MRSLDNIVNELATEADEAYLAASPAWHLSKVQKGTRLRNIETKQFGRAVGPVPPSATEIDVLVPTKLSKAHRGAGVRHSWAVEKVRVA